MKKTLIAAVVLLLVVPGALLIWVRATLSSETVRTEVAGQVSRALGQPVTIGSIGPTLLPRLALTLGEVRIGDPARIIVDRVDVGAAFAALFSRRIEDASVRASGAQIELPLPTFTMRSTPSEGGRLEIVSVKEILLTDLAIVSGNRMLTGEVDVVPEDSGLTIRRIALTADDTSMEISGRLTSLAGPTGEIAIAGESLNMRDLAAVASAFGSEMDDGVPTQARALPEASSASSMSLAIALDARRALFGTLALEELKGNVQLAPEHVVLDPITFGVFGGRGDGTATVSLGGTPNYRLQASLDNIDVAAATSFAGKPDTMTGRLKAALDVEGRMTSADAALQTAYGTASLEATDGTVSGLGLVQTLSVMTSGVAGLAGAAASGSPSAPDTYSRVGLSLDIADGLAKTDDFRFESSDVLLTAAGTVALDGSAVNLVGEARLSNGMSAPATVTGPVTSPRVQVDVGDVAGQALKGLEGMDVEDAMKKLLGGLDGLFGR